MHAGIFVLNVYRLLIFVLFFKKYISNTTRLSNNLDPDRAWRFVEPNLGQNRLQS